MNVAERKTEQSRLFRTLCLIAGWLFVSAIVANAQKIDDLGEFFLQERPLWYHAEDTANSPNTLVEALKGDSWTDWLLLREGERDIELGQYSLADYTMSELIDSRPPSLIAAVALLNRGTAALRRKEYGLGRFYFSEAITEAMQRSGDEADRIAGIALYSIGFAHAVERDQPIEKTVGLLEEFLDHYPDNPRVQDALSLLAELAEMRGDCEAALGYYDKLFDNFPTSENLEAQNHKAQCLARLGRYKEAEELLENMSTHLDNAGDDNDSLAARHEQTRAEGRLLRGEIELLLKNYSAAENAFLPLISDPVSPYRRAGILGLAGTYQAARQNDSALALYNQILAEDSLDTVWMRARYNRALLLASMGQAAAADSIFQTIGGNEKDLMSDRALVELGISAYERRDYAAAANALEKAVTLASDDVLRARAYTLLGVTHLGEGQPVGAINAFDAADKISSGRKASQDNDVPEAKLLRGITLARVNRSAEAITALNRFIEAYSDNSGADQALYWLGESYYRSSLYKASVDVLGTLVEQHPGSPLVPDALYTMGWAQLRQKNFDKAETVFAQLVKAFPLSAYTAEAQIRRGDALYLAGRFSAAIDGYQQAVRLNPLADEAAYVSYQTALAEYQLGQLSEADTMFQSFATCYASSDLVNDALYLRGDIALRQGMSGRAIEHMGQFIGRSNQEDLLPRAYGAIGEAEAKLGNDRLADAAFSIVLDRYPASSYVARAREQMEAIAANRRDHADEATTGVQCATATRIAIDRGEIHRITGRPANGMREYWGIDQSALEATCRQDLWLGIARGHMALGEPAQAVDTLKLIVDQYPNGAAAHEAMLDLSAGYLSRGDTANAATYLERILAEQGDSSNIGSRAALQLALMHARAGQYDTARALLRQITRHYPTSPEAANAWIALSQFANDGAQTDTVRAGLEQSAQHDDSTGVAALLALVDLDARAANNQAVASSLEEIIRRFGGNWELWSSATIRLGEVYERLGSKSKAKEAYEGLLRRGCDDAIRKQAQEHLDALSRL